jgi:hypothetical protein
MPRRHLSCHQMIVARSASGPMPVNVQQTCARSWTRSPGAARSPVDEGDGGQRHLPGDGMTLFRGQCRIPGDEVDHCFLRSVHQHPRGPGPCLSLEEAQEPHGVVARRMSDHGLAAADDAAAEATGEFFVHG